MTVVRPNEETALALAKDRPATPKEIARLAEAVGEEAARWAFTQWVLRGRALAKFARANEMLFTRDGLEMASHESVASLHAALLTGALPDGPDARGSGGRQLLDATCGIGADTVALAMAGPTTSCDTNPEHAEMARHNLMVHGLGADVRTVDSMSLDWSGLAVVVDPQRRTARGRTLDPQEFSPPLDKVFAKCRTARRALVKLSPLLPDSLLEKGDGLAFVSHNGECCEALVTFGAFEGRCAFHVESGSRLDAKELTATYDGPLAYIQEADPAAIRAHALGRFGLAGLGDSNGYLTGDEARSSPWLRNYRVVWHGPFHETRLRAAVREHGLQIVAVKKRGVAIEPERLRKRLAGPEGKNAVVILYAVGKGVRAALAERA